MNVGDIMLRKYLTNRESYNYIVILQIRKLSKQEEKKGILLDVQFEYLDLPERKKWTSRKVLNENFIKVEEFQE